MRKRALRCGALLLLFTTSEAWAVRSTGGVSLTNKAATSSILLASSPPSEDKAELKAYKSEASSLFGNLRVPAALFAGASAGAAFALPVSHGAETVRVGLVKRLYALLMMGALSSEIVAVVVSTLAVGALSARTCPLTNSVEELLKEHYALHWASARLHFLSGLIMFILGIGIRAWITIVCPIIAKAALGIVLSSALLCVAFIQDMEKSSSLLDGIFRLPIHYLQLLIQQSKKSPFFTAALLLSCLTNLYIAGNVPHVYHFLSKNQ